MRFTFSRRAAALMLASLAGVTVHTLAPPPAPVQAASRPRETRGLWVLRTTLTSVASIEAMVNAAVDGGYNTILVQVRGRGEAFYTSAIDPRAADLGRQRTDFDPLAATIAFAHRAGLQVHAWVNVNLVSSATTLPASADHVVRRHPEWLMVPAPLAARLKTMNPRSPAYVDAIARWTRTSAPRIEGLFLSPILPAAQDYTISVIDELLASYELDGLHLDYIRYPAETFDYSPAALDAFRADRAATTSVAERRRLDASSDVSAWPKAFPAAWEAFRRARLTDLVARIARVARAVRPGLVISAAVVPNAEEALAHRFQDWPDWARAGYLDVVCPMVYTQDAGVFASQVQAMHRWLGPTPMWVGIGAYRLPVAHTATNVRVARAAGAAGVLLFSYDSLTGADAPSPRYLSALKPVIVEPDGGRPERSR